MCSKHEATPSPASAACHHGSVVVRGRRAGWWNKEEKDADRGKESFRLHPGFIFSKTHWGPATCLSPECRSTLVSFSLSPLVAKQNHNFIIHPFLLFLPTLSPFLVPDTIFHFSRNQKKKKQQSALPFDSLVNTRPHVDDSGIQMRWWDVFYDIWDLQRSAA